MSITTITHPDGSKTVVESSGGCFSGCTWTFAVVLLLGSCLEYPLLILPTIVILLIFAAIVAARRRP